MNTEIIRLDENESNGLRCAAEVIKSGGTVVFPTETVYGLGASALDEAACKKIFEAKGRPQDNPLIVHVGDFDIKKYVKEIPEKATKLMETFWPGPITIIMEKSDIIPDVVTAGLNRVALRMPLCKTARKLIEYASVPIAAPSANISGRPSPTTIEHCIEDLDGKVNMIIGGETSKVGLESTVVDVKDEIVTILRPGGITKEMLEEAVGVGNVFIDPAIMGQLADGEKPKAPGMKYRHYAPKAPLVIFSGDDEKVIETINNKIREYNSKGMKIGILCAEENVHRYQRAECVISIGSRNSPGIIAANLFDCLREFDKMELNYLFSEGFSEDGIGLAIMNRLRKASGNNIIEV